MAKFSTGYTFGFAAVVCVVLSLAVASASMGLRPIQEVNERRDLQEKILAALGLPEDPDQRLQGTEIDETYAERVDVIVIDGEGDLEPDKTLADVLAEHEAADTENREPTLHAVYVRRDGEQIGAYAIPMDGKGLWGPISGYLAIDSDGVTVSGVTFFAPKETPGLGYEIVNPGFTADWIGKKIWDGEPKPIRVVKGDPERICGDDIEHCVDGVSGATVTSNGVDDMVAEAIEIYDPYLQRVRTNAGGG